MITLQLGLDRRQTAMELVPVQRNVIDREV